MHKDLLSIKDLQVEEIESISMLEDNFEGARPGYNPNDSNMSRIICRL